MSVELRKEVQRLMEQADIRKAQGDEEGALALYRQAAELEEQALDHIPTERSQTRSIVAASAVSLYSHAKDENEVIRLGMKCVDDPSLTRVTRQRIAEMISPYLAKRHAELWQFCVKQWREGEWSKLGDDDMRQMVIGIDATLRRFQRVCRAIEEFLDMHRKEAAERGWVFCACQACHCLGSLQRLADGVPHHTWWTSVVPDEPEWKDGQEDPLEKYTKGLIGDDPA